MRAFLLCLTLLGAAEAVAQRRPQEFVAPREMSQDELEEAKARSKYRIDAFDSDLEDVKPFPWRAVGLMGLALLVALPFGIRAYAQTAQELGGGRAHKRSRP